MSRSPSRSARNRGTGFAATGATKSAMSARAKREAFNVFMIVSFLVI
jgi:hypothetical protein